MGSGQATYYTKLAREDYYTKGQEPPGVWIGTGAAKLGLIGTVKEKELKNVYRGFSPDGKTKLVQNAGKMDGDLSRDPGWDLTFSAPKSCSIVAAIADEETRQAIETAHFEAVRKISEELERLTVVRKGKGGKEREQAGLVIATYQHSTSRAISADVPPDMQLHTHALVLNIGVSPSDGKTRSITSRQFYQNEKILGAGYRAELAQNLEKIGFEIERVRDSFEIKGVPKPLIAEFSKRAGQVEEQTKGLSDPKEIEKTKLRGRRVKDAYKREELFSLWSEKCNEFGFTSEKIRELQSHTTQERSLEREKKEAVKSALETLTAEKPTFTRDEFQRAVMVEAQARGIGFREAMYATQDYLKYQAKYRGKEGNNALFTTPEKVIEQKAEKRDEEIKELKNFRQKSEAEGYQVVGVTFKRQGAKNLEQKTGIKSGSVQEGLNFFEGDLQGANEKAEVRKQEVKTDIELKYATHRINRKIRRKALKRINQKPTSEFMHTFKYATHQISKKQRDFLNVQLRRSRFNVNEKSIVVVDATRKEIETYSKAKRLIADFESRGAKVYTTEEIMRARISQTTQQEKKTEQELDLTLSLKYQR